MSPIKVIVHSTGRGTCLLTGKETEGLTLTFEDGTVKDAFLSFRSFRQILALKCAKQDAISETKPVPTLAGNAQNAK